MAPNNAHILNIVDQTQRNEALIKILSAIHEDIAKLATAQTIQTTEIALIRSDLDAIKNKIETHDERIASLETSRTEVRGGFNAVHFFITGIGGAGLWEVAKFIFSK